MRQFSVFLATGLMLLATGGGGCHPAAQVDTNAEWIDEDEFNDLAVRTALDEQVRGGTVAERSIYEHHFEPGGAMLNDLGERQIEILAAAYRDAGRLEINVANGGDVTEQQHAGRVETVRQELLRRGIALDRADARAGRPGGPGLASAYVLQALTEPAEESGEGADRTRGGGNGRSGGSSGSSGSRGGSGMTGSRSTGPYGR